MAKSTEIPPVIFEDKYYEAIESAILELLKKELYLPIIRILKARPNALHNTKSHLEEAIRKGKLSFDRGLFSGTFSSRTSSELKKLGATWKRGKGWSIRKDLLPSGVVGAIEASAASMAKTISRIDKSLQKVLPEQIAGKLKTDKLISTTIWKVDGDLRKTAKALSIQPKLTRDQVAKISAEYTENMRLSIRDWSNEEIVKLRESVMKSTVRGDRYEGMVDSIVKRYGVTQSKAKFLARQETNLLVAKFKEARYTDAGIKQYRWKNAAGSAKHPVRPMHKALNGKIFSWDDPPITSPEGDRNNPGEDYNCRCFASPIVKF